MNRSPLLLLAAAVFLLHALLTGGHLTSPDEELLYRMAEGMALRGTTALVPLEADLASGLLPEGFPASAAFATRHNDETGEFFAQYLPLQPLLAMPLVWVGVATEGLFAEPFAKLLWPSMAMSYLDPLEPSAKANAAWRRFVVVLLFNPIVAAISAVLLARVGRLLTGSRRAGMWAAVAWAFGTIAWAHSRTFFTEPLAGLLVLGALDQLFRWYRQPLGSAWKHAAGVGICLGLANLARVDSPFFTVGIMAAMAAMAAWKLLEEESWARGSRRLPVVDLFLAGGLALGAWIALQTFNTLRFGPDLTSGYGDQSEGVAFTTPLLIGLQGLLFSPGKGLLFFSPALLIGLWGWRRVPHHQRWVLWTMLAALVPFFIAMAKWQNWDGGWCWGPRHIVQIHLPLMLGVAFLEPVVRGLLKRMAVAGVLVVGGAVQIYGASQSSTDYFREYFLTYGDLVYHRVNLRGMQAAALEEEFVLRYRESDGSTGPVAAPHNLPAPMVDSLYVPQHTQWYSYAEMWRMGYSDLLIHNALRRGTNPDRWSEAP